MEYIVFIILMLLVIGFFVWTYVSVKRRDKEIQEKLEEYHAKCLAMTSEELLEIENSIDLVETVAERINEKLSAYETPEKGFSYLSEPEQTVYVLFEYSDNCFILDFFGGERRELCVPRFGECLARVGATEYKQAFDEFMETNKIDVNDLSMYAGRYWTSKRNKDINCEAFEAFDKKIEEFPMLDEWVGKYIKENISYF